MLAAFLDILSLLTSLRNFCEAGVSRSLNCVRRYLGDLIHLAVHLCFEFALQACHIAETPYPIFLQRHGGGSFI
jgi:hypothetical protein